MLLSAASAARVSGRRLVIALTWVVCSWEFESYQARASVSSSDRLYLVVLCHPSIQGLKANGMMMMNMMITPYLTTPSLCLSIQYISCTGGVWGR
jgi:hypothetical protein